MTTLIDRQKSILRAFLEHALITENKSFRMKLTGLRLRALIQEDKADAVAADAQGLCQTGLVAECRQEKDELVVVLADKFKLTALPDDRRNVLLGNVVKRALLFHLYELFKKILHREAARTALVPLSAPLGVTEEQVKFFAQELIDARLLKYGVADGGRYTCSLTEFGADIAKLNETLLQRFPGINMNSIINPELVASAQRADPQKVFVVHGRNKQLRDAMFTFLRSINLSPLEWNEGVLMSGEASPHIGDVLNKMFEKAQAVVILMTGEDWAKLDDQFLEPGESSEPLTLQARANVLFEAGRAFASHAKRTVIVELGNLRPFSDVAGRHSVRLNNTVAMRQTLAERLKGAGCAVAIEGKTDWHKAGDFEVGILPITPPASPGDADIQFKKDTLQIFSGAHEVFWTDAAYSIPTYLRLIPDESCGVVANTVHNDWFFLARQNGGLSASAHDLVTQIQALLSLAEHAINKSAGLPKRDKALEIYGQLVPRFNEFAAALQRHLEVHKDIHHRPTSIQRLPNTLPERSPAQPKPAPAPAPTFLQRVWAMFGGGA